MLTRTRQSFLKKHKKSFRVTWKFNRLKLTFPSLLPYSTLPFLPRFFPSPVFPKCHLPMHTHSHIPANIPNLVSFLVYIFYTTYCHLTYVFFLFIMFVAYLPLLKCKLMKTNIFICVVHCCIFSACNSAWHKEITLKDWLNEWINKWMVALSCTTMKFPWGLMFYL